MRLRLLMLVGVMVCVGFSARGSAFPDLARGRMHRKQFVTFVYQVLDRPMPRLDQVLRPSWGDTHDVVQANRAALTNFEALVFWNGCSPQRTLNCAHHLSIDALLAEAYEQYLHRQYVLWISNALKMDKTEFVARHRSVQLKLPSELLYSDLVD
jgi:hypothetical protein